ncbi:unnamed protein product [Mytilus edulis]|uniref:Endonuclease/exonuclease/phosphatase domain-containing protein n=1 Tax=Mytilus edulis TaxID=6550 RepID=A0A8S3UG98_MYTED|nr:unnamed protein product [Mytilus edulis]
MYNWKNNSSKSRMAAVHWLKANNNLYQSATVNEDWVSDSTAEDKDMWVDIIENEIVHDSENVDDSNVPQDTPPTSALTKDTPSASALVSDSPSTSALISDTPSTSALVKYTPSTSALIKDTPSTSALIKDAPSTSVLIKDTPPTSAIIKDTPSKSAFIKDTPSKSAFIKDTPSTSAFIKDTPSTSILITDTPSTSAIIKDTPSISVLITDTPPTSAHTDENLFVKRETKVESQVQSMHGNVYDLTGENDDDTDDPVANLRDLIHVFSPQTKLLLLIKYLVYFPEKGRYQYRYVSARLPSQEDEKLFTLVNQVQRHTHSASCRKTGKICRFNFPKPITSTTLVTPPSTDHPEETPEQKSQKNNISSNPHYRIEDKYAVRPKALENWNLALFASYYIQKSTNTQHRDESIQPDLQLGDSINNESIPFDVNIQKAPEEIEITTAQGESFTMKKRRKQFIIRYHKFSIDRQPEKPTKEDDNMLHVYTTNARVDSYELSAKLYTLTAVDIIPESMKHKNLPDDQRFTGGLKSVIQPKIGARIMLTRNLDVSDGLSNWVQGKIAGFILNDQITVAVLVQFSDIKIGKEAILQITRKQFPIRLCWACTVHKIQGQSLTEVFISFRGNFTTGQAYVALSRSTSLSGLFLTDFSANRIRVSSTVHSEMERLRSMCKTQPQLLLPDTDCPHVNISLLNARSAKHHFIDIQKDPLLLSCDIICLTEAHCFDNSKMNIDGFTCNKLSYKQQQQTHGLLLYSKQELAVQLVRALKLPFVELIEVKITKGTCSIILILIYKSPSSSSSECVKTIQDLCPSSESEDVIILGDFNLNKQSVPAHYAQLNQYFQTLNYQQCVSNQTTIYESTLDLVFSTGKLPHIMTNACYYISSYLYRKN